MRNTDNCQLCGVVDSWKHSLVECTTTRCVWALADAELSEKLVEMTDPSAKRWIFELRDSLSHAQFVKMVVTLWAVWTARRRAIHENIFQSLFIERFIRELDSIKVVTSTPVTRRIARAIVQSTWKQSDKGFYKIHMDEGLSRDGKTGASVAICRDRVGNYLGSSFLVLSAPLTRPRWRLLLVMRR
jgi:hypothetical protein